MSSFLCMVPLVVMIAAVCALTSNSSSPLTLAKLGGRARLAGCG